MFPFDGMLGSMKILGITVILVGITFAIWTAEALHFGHRISATLLLAGISALALGFAKGRTKIAPHNVVGNLADVLQVLGEQLRDANGRERDHDTIHFGSAEIELSLTAETGTEGAITFKVIEGVSKRNISSTTRLNVTVHPTGMLEIGQ